VSAKRVDSAVPLGEEVLSAPPDGTCSVTTSALTDAAPPPASSRAVSVNVYVAPGASAPGSSVSTAEVLPPATRVGSLRSSATLDTQLHSSSSRPSGVALATSAASVVRNAGLTSAPAVTASICDTRMAPSASRTTPGGAGGGGDMSCAVSCGAETLMPVTPLRPGSATSAACSAPTSNVATLVSSVCAAAYDGDTMVNATSAAACAACSTLRRWPADANDASTMPVMVSAALSTPSCVASVAPSVARKPAAAAAVSPARLSVADTAYTELAVTLAGGAGGLGGSGEGGGGLNGGGDCGDGDGGAGGGGDGGGAFNASSGLGGGSGLGGSGLGLGGLGCSGWGGGPGGSGPGGDGGGGGGGGLGGGGLGGGGLYAGYSPLALPAQALKSSACGPPVTPAAMLVGVEAVPLANIWKASKGDTAVPLGAPSVGSAGVKTFAYCSQRVA
jgi:hypothetical protein